MDNQIFFEIKDLFKEFEDDHTLAVNHVSFRIDKGDSIGLVGESGCGKSTLARIISGLEKPTSGSVLFRGKPYCLKNGKKGKKTVNMVFQDPIDSFDSHLTVYTSLYEALIHTKKISRIQAGKEIKAVLETVELPVVYAQRKISQLSGGECQRIGIARAILTEPELLICDEATSALDVSVQAQIVHLLRRLKKEKSFTYLFISHDLALVASMCNRILVMYRGELVESGTASEVLKHPYHPYTKLLISCGEAFTIDSSGNTRQMPKTGLEDGYGSECCSFYSYCSQRKDMCRKVRPILKPCGDEHQVACHICLE